MAKKKIEEGDSPKMTVLAENGNSSLDRLIEVYKLDRRKAKILYDNNKNNNGYMKSRICLFEYPNGDFRIVSLTRKHGFSVNAVIYSREKNNWSISYKQKTKSFYFCYGNTNIVKHLSLALLNGYCQGDGGVAYNYLLTKFGWLRNIQETNLAHVLSFTTIVRHKLYNEKAILRHIYGCPYPIAKMLSENHGSYSPWDFAKVWKQAKKVLINIENLKPEMVNSPYFIDSTKMASTLGRKINCSWGEKRLKQEHDDFNKEIINVVLEFEPLKYLNVSKVFLDFAEFSGYEILTTNHGLIEEGKRMKHCVGTYSSNVESGRSGIYRYSGRTLELCYDKPWNNPEAKKQVRIAQYQDYSNSTPPKELREEIQRMVDLFNENIVEEYKEHVHGHRAPMEDFFIVNPLDELPF
jgi:hypothetical protein